VGDFVTADGRFLPNAALWLEWATGRPLPDRLPEALPLVIAAPDPAVASIPGFEEIDGRGPRRSFVRMCGEWRRLTPARRP
jgi:hypothetical protein